MTFQSELIKSFQFHADRIAVEYGERKISYASLFQRANSISQQLIQAGLEKETIVGIDLTDKSEIITSIIGVINAGCVFVLLDRSLPASRFDVMMMDLNLQHIISSDPKASRYQKIEEVWTYEKVSSNEAVISSLTYPEFNSLDSLYIYFTSGSTGTPKGIVGKNESLLQFLQWEIETFNLKENTRVSQFISPYFDAFLRDIFAPLLSGGTICIPPDEEDFFTPEKIIPWVDSSQINLIHCVPSVFALINNNSLSKEHFKQLRYVLMSGEKIMAASLKNWYDLFSERIKLVNFYGLTETTMIRSFHIITQADVNKGKIPIGSPIPETELLILKKDFKPCNTLIPGDLYIVSNYVTKGYLNQPELTHKKFLDIPGYEHKAVKTGDKARKLPSKTIELIGREDRQIKLNGIRIELDDIESALSKYKDLQDQAVILHKDETGIASIYAFLLPETHIEDPTKLKSDLGVYLQDTLPGYMIPADMVVMDKFPFLPNGKLDYKGLQACIPSKQKIVLPKNELEEQLLLIWKELLGDKPISTEDAFYKIGGNSLLIIRLIGKISKTFKVKIKINELFNNPTITQQSALIQSKNKTSEISIPISPPKEHYSLSSAQRRLFFLHELDKTNLAFNLPQLCKLEGKLDIKKLYKAIQALSARHDSFRTYFELIDGEPRQRIVENIEVDISFYTGDEGKADDLVKEFIKPFDLSQASLFRLGIIRLSEEEHILIVDMHHIVSDGMSETILLKEFMNLYNESPLPEEKLQYKDYAEWLQGDAQQKRIAKQQSFWLNLFSDKTPLLDLPSDFTRPQVKTYEGAIELWEIEEGETALLKSVADREGVTLYILLLTMFNILLSKLSGQEDIAIGTPTAGRKYPELQNLVGFFANTIPLRSHPKGELSFKNFLAQVKTQTLACFEHEEYPYESLIDDLRVEREPNRNPLFDIMFAYLNFEKTVFQIPGLSLKPYEGGQTISKLDLSVFAYNVGEKIHLNFEYSTQLFSPKTIRQFIAGFKKIVSTVLEEKDLLLSEIEILLPKPRVEQRKIIVLASNPLEERLVEIWSGILPVEKTQIDVTESFLALGGDTESANIFAQEILKSFGVDIPATSILDNPDIRSFSKFLMTFKRTPAASVDVD